MLAAKGTGEAQRIAACYAEAQWVPAAIAVCLASPQLTQDQRIFLECAAQANGSLHATAVCTGGKLAMKELGNCRGKRFGEGDCFNENNELRKLARAFGTDIGPSSVAADVVNLQLRIWDVAATPMLSVGSQIAGDVLKIAQERHLLADITNPKSVLFHVAGPVGTVIENICDLWGGC
jgi:hypothetical protein